MRNLGCAFLILSFATSCVGQDGAAMSKYCAEHFTGGIALRPRTAIESKSGREILDALLGADLQAGMAKTKSVLGIDPRRLEELAFFVDQEIAGNIEKREHAESLQNQKRVLNRIGFALHRFHERYGSFPDDDGHRRTSKGNLSWRVHVLPVFGYANIYQKFHLDEPWDSPHNKRLIPQMPDCYFMPGLKTERGKTCIQVLTGKGALFHGDVEPTLNDLTDGLGSTALAVVSAPEKAAIWTKPGGIDFDPTNPLEALGDFGDSTLFLTATKPRMLTGGSSVVVPRDAEPQTILSLINPASGQSMGQLLPSDMDRQAGRPAIVATIVDDLTPQDEAALAAAIATGLGVPEDRMGKQDLWARFFQRSKRARVKTVHGTRVLHYEYAPSRSGRYGVAFPDKRTVVAAPLDHLERMLTVKRPNPLADRLRKGLESNDLFGTMTGTCAALIMSRAYLAMGYGMGGDGKARSYTIKGSLSSDQLLQVDVRCRKDQSLTYTLFSLGRALGEEPIVASLGLQASSERTSTGVSASVTRPKNWLKLLANSHKARAEATSKERVEQFASLGYSFSEFADTYAKYPSYDRKSHRPLRGKGLSWRVHLLLNLGEFELYQDFRLNEPWDSPHNKALISRMPAFFKSRGVTKPGYTSMHVLRGKGAPFENTGKDLRRGAVPHSDSTVAVVEAGPNTAVPWTKPVALVYDQKNPRNALGNIEWPLRCVMFDGTAVEVPKSVSDGVLRSIFEHADGKRGDLSGFKILNPE